MDTLVYAARLKDQEVLKNSSSGGAFTALSDVFLDRGDAVVCAVYDYKKDQTKFQLIESAEERDSARGSKYMQSIPGNIFKEAKVWLEQHPKNKLLFVGMGCQAAGFQKYIETVGLRERVTVIDIICHGSASPMIWNEYAQSLRKNKGEISYLTFKDKRNGWRHPTAFAEIDHLEVSLRPYVKIFYNKCALRPACHKCPYTTTERTTDITIGDYWHIEEKIPEFYDETGNSLILVHTEQGKRIFAQAKEKMDYCESNTTDCWQINLERPTEMSPNREKFWKDYHINGIDYIIKKYGTVSFAQRVKRKMNQLVKRVKR